MFSMIDPKFIDDIAKRLGDAIPQSLRDFDADVQRNFRGVLQAAFAKLDLVTREEFDVQAKVLARTRTKLEVLEQQVARLEEEHLNKKTGKEK